MGALGGGMRGMEELVGGVGSRWRRAQMGLDHEWGDGGGWAERLSEGMRGMGNGPGQRG